MLKNEPYRFPLLSKQENEKLVKIPLNLDKTCNIDKLVRQFLKQNLLKISPILRVKHGMHVYN